MIASSVGLNLLLGLSALAATGPEDARSGRCPECGRDAVEVRSDVAALRTSPRWRARARAARRLGEVDAKGHPEAVLALASALANDREGRVREDAAVSLRRIAPPIPAIHEAIDRASRLDPDRVVRREARSALDAPRKRCMADCPICGPLPTGSAFRSPVTIPPGWEAWLGSEGASRTPIPGPKAIPPSDLPEALPEP